MPTKTIKGNTLGKTDLIEIKPKFVAMIEIRSRIYAMEETGKTWMLKENEWIPTHWGFRGEDVSK